MWVVKLGGSLADSDDLPNWLRCLSLQRLLVVPGGGPFAEAVRLAQRRWSFADSAAHDMALLGMRQYGLMLVTMLRALNPAVRPWQIGEEVDLPAVWLPVPEQLADAGLPASWEVTSDTLAAWLALQVGATDLLLVKAGWQHPTAPPARTQEVAVTELWREGLIDGAFHGLMRGAGLRCWLCGASQAARAVAGFGAPAAHFVQIR